MKKSYKDNREEQRPRRLTLSRETLQRLNAPELKLAWGGDQVEIYLSSSGGGDPVSSC